ncbi:hypothetical protein TCAL_01818 [Tigriopus californicus]|uniref:Uncharacterized protein n=1 Tax=Tigriopus californicus TaxID=6832 RepID=A0A553N8F7_TIGCA|nr:hypothetical protein TCAL_01818 [Tigriopus californicus]
MVQPSFAPPTPTVDSVPHDNPGLPIQDEICPFHQRHTYWAELLRKNQAKEFRKNEERFAFLKWVNKSFGNITVIPPGTGVMHQVNLEYLARIVTCQDGLLFPDSLIGTDSHTTMINGLGVLGWGVGTLDAESVMFGHPITMTIPKVVGCRISGQIPDYTTSTEIVLLITKKLRHAGVNGCFVEFFGPSLEVLSMADRATIANMSPEYGALVSYFPYDELTLDYLQHAGRSAQVECIRKYLTEVGMLRTPQSKEPEYSEVLEIDLSEVQPCVSGPKRSKDKVLIHEIGSDFHKALIAHQDSSKGFGLTLEQTYTSLNVNVDGAFHTITNGSVLLAAITSCSNTSNPSVLLGAGVLAKKAIEAGLAVSKCVKTSLAPGSGVVTSYLLESGVMPYLYMLGFEVIGYGCSSCVDNTKPLPGPIVDAIRQGSLVCCGVMSGNRNFESRVQADIKANYLASPMLVIAYSIAGRVDIDFEREPIGFTAEGKPIFLSEVWPSRQEIQEMENRFVIPAIFRNVVGRISYGNKHWSALETAESDLHFPWDQSSTFIKPPLYITELAENLPETPKSWLKGMRCLLKLGDNVTSDHISPAGSIVRNSPAADYLSSLGLAPREYSSYGARRGNCEVMMRGTFGHIRLKNELSKKEGPFTTHLPSGVPTTIFEASQRYKVEKVPLFVIAGENFGRGTARDWATKGPLLLGVKAILALSFDSNYRANLVKSGILPVQIDRTTYEILTGREILDIELPESEEDEQLKVSLVLNHDFDISADLRLDNEYEKSLYQDGGVIRQKMRDLNTFRGDLLWCGVHDVAPFPEALSSVYPSLDNCCRQHDQCPLIVDRGQCWKGICNKSLLFPILGCDCEQQFRKCLDAIAYNSRDSSFIYAPVTVSESKLSESVGFGYFSVAPKLADRRCIQKTRPLMGCAENFNGYCTKFVFNEKRPMRWQLFRLKDLDQAGLLF